MKPKPDLETEYRRALRHTIRNESVLIIHSEETQPDRENNPTGEWTIAHTTHEIGDVTTYVVEVHDPKGKWVGDVSPDRATTLLNRFTIYSHEGPTPKGAPQTEYISARAGTPTPALSVGEEDHG